MVKSACGCGKGGSRCRLNRLRVRSDDSECSADGPGSPRSPLGLRSVSVIERAQSNTDSQADEQGANSGRQMLRQMSVSSVV